MKQLFTIAIIFLSICGCTVNKSTKSINPYSGGAVGCGNFIVYKLSEDKASYLSVRLDVGAIELVEFQAYVIGKADVVQVLRKKFAGAIDASLCNDVMPDKPEKLIEEEATAGILEVRVDKEELEKAKIKEGYRVRLTLKKMVFENQTVDYLVIDDVYVGWLPG